MNRTPRRRLHAVVLTALLAVGIASFATACKPPAWAWRAGKTHGAIIEPTAGRASLGIYRVPTGYLYEAQKQHGVATVQALIWHFGQPPQIEKRFTFRGRSITLAFGTKTLRSVAHQLVFGDPADLRGAVIDAHRHKDCLALTLFSYGKVTRNWTHKGVGCLNGSV